MVIYVLYFSCWFIYFLNLMLFSLQSLDNSACRMLFTESIIFQVENFFNNIIEMRRWHLSVLVSSFPITILLENICASTQMYRSSNKKTFFSKNIHAIRMMIFNDVPAHMLHWVVGERVLSFNKLGGTFLFFN